MHAAANATRRQRFSAAAATFFATLLALPVNAAVALPEVPLQTSATVSPNIMFILDDSGSMQSEILPSELIDDITKKSNGDKWTPIVIGRVFPRVKEVYGSTFDGKAVGEYENIVADPDNVYGKIVRTSQFNPQYYNPDITYQPWVKADGSSWGAASTTCAYWNPADTSKGCVDLTKSPSYSDVWWQRTSVSSTCTTSACIAESGSRTIEFAIYYTFSGDPSKPADKYDSGKYTKKTVTGTELNNFANWFQFYRSRILASRAGIGRAFATLPDSASGSPRIGYATINTTDTLVKAVRPFAASDRSDFYSKLYGGTIPTKGTPLRKSLYDVGKYYQTETGSDDPWRTGVGDSSHAKYDELLACRQSFAMLMTDGYWNGELDSTARSTVGDADSGAGYPFAGTHSGSVKDNKGNFLYTDTSTLADVAYHYWKSDLRSSIDDLVPATTLNPNKHQHMVTYGIGLGVNGAVKPDDAFAEIGKASGSLTWPNPFAGSTGYTTANKIDDLLHASVNSRGGFFSAGDPDTFASELTKTLASIVERTASGSNVSANSVSLGTDTKVFQASYVSGQWTGELAAYAVTSSGLATSPSWRASQKLPAAGSRTLYTYQSTATPKGVQLDWANLTATQKADLGSSDVLDYLRGVTSKERQNGGSFRNRTHALGDIVYSSPAYSSDSDTVFVGANDGMLHAFDAKTGVERFAYMPAGIDWAKLKNLSSPSYTHNFFVDGPVTISDKATTPAKNYLVGTLGRGGKGVYALDVTTPASFGGTDALWEYTSHADMGLALSRPIIAKLNNGSTAAIVANGPNSTNGDAALFMINIADGSLIAHLPVGKAGDNGLSAPRGWDSDGNGTLDYVYAGDLKGNLWKFDLSQSCTTNCDKKWEIANSKKPLFEAQDAAGKAQPISGGVSLAMDPNSYKLWVLFGTGRFLTTSDPAETATQSWYGLIDEGSAIVGDRDHANFKLKERKIVVVAEIDVKDNTGKVVGKRKVRAFEKATSGDMVGKHGWFVDLTMPPATSGAPRVQEGERMVGQPSVIGGVLLASSIIPSTNACVGGGRGYLNAIDPFTGARTNTGFFDGNNDGQFNDTIKDGGDDAPIGSVDLDVAMPTDPALVDDRAVVGGSDGRRRDIKTNNPAQVGRISWRELIKD